MQSNKTGEPNKTSEKKMDESNQINESQNIDDPHEMEDSIFTEPIISNLKNRIPLPLLLNVDKQGVPSPDSSTLIREIFHDKLHEEQLSSNTAENLALLPKCSALKEYATYAKATHDSYKELMAEILTVEESIKYGHEEHILREEIINSDPAIRDRVILQRRPLFRDLKKRHVNKYCLIQSDDLLPEPHERVIDCRLIKHERIRRRYAGNKITAETLKKAKCELYLNGNSIKFVACPVERRDLPVITANENEHVIFVAKPSTVIFTDCKPGCMYKHIVKLTNVSKSNGRFKLVPLPIGCKFHVTWKPLPGHTKIVAPGMAVSIVIQYKGDRYEELLNYLKINVLDGKSLKIRIETYRTPPILKVPSFRNLDHDLSNQELILAGTIENGYCFLGDCVTTIITLINDGGIGRFWICNEESWCFAELEDIPIGNTLSLPPYTINPFYFELDVGNLIDLQVTFKPNKYGVQVETLYFLCDNCTVRTVELIGDAIIFRKIFLTFEDMDKIFSIDMDDDEDCKHWLDMGQVLPNRLVSEKFTVTNTSGVELVYRWEKRKINLQVVAKDILLEMDETSYDIVPVSGVICPKRSVGFTVTCPSSPACTGHYRYVLSMVILNIPSASVTEESGIKIPEEKGIGSDLIDVIVGEVEVWMQVIPLRVVLKPWVISITGGKVRIGRKRVVRFFYVINESYEKITIEWDLENYHNDGASVGLHICPTKSEISANSSLPSILVIQALSPGKFKLKIQCSVNDGEKTLELVVLGEISEAIVGPSHYNLDFGLVKHGTRAAMKLNLLNKTNKPAVWQLKEFIYDFTNRCLLEPEYNSQVTADLGLLCHRGSTCQITYNLITRQTGLFCSLLVLSSLTPNDSTPNAYILVTADVVAPKIYITAPIHNNAVLTISNRLFIGLSTSYKITLKNVTRVPASFTWGTPTGCDSSCLRVTFNPSKAEIPPAESLMITISINPQESGEIRHFYVPCFAAREPTPVILSIVCNVDCLNVTFHMPRGSADELYTVKDDLNCSPISWSVRGRDIYFPWIKKIRKSKSETCTCHKKRQNSPVILSIPETVFPKEKGVINPSTCSIHYKLASVNSRINIINSEENIHSTDYDEYILQNEEAGQDNPNNGHLENNSLQKDLLEDEENKNLDLHDEWLNSEANQPSTIEEQTNDLVPIEEETIVPPCTEYQADQEDPGGHTEQIIKLVPRDVIIIEKPKRLKVIDIDEVPPPEEPPEEEPLVILPSSKLALLEWLRSYAVIEFLDVPCFTPVCRMFVVRNETPLTAILNVSVTNYPEQDKESEIDILKKIQAKLNGVKQDEWRSSIREGSGLVVAVKPALSFLEAHGVIPVYVWVYANTWGSYMEVIKCNLTGLPPFSIRVNIRVTSHPVMFPMMLNCKNQRPVLRFGTLAYRDVPVTRKIRVTNTSSVALSVVWNIFLKTANDEPVEDEQPFNVVMDMFTKWSNDRSSLTVDGKCYSNTTLEVFQTPYYGQISSTVFQVSPRELHIPAKGESIFHVTADPSFYFNQYNLGTEELKAALVGMVRISPRDESKSQFYYRPQGTRLDPVIAHLEVAIDIPHLTLVEPEEKVQFKVSAIRLISSHSYTPYKQTQLLVFKNNHKSLSVVKMNVEVPFNILKLSTLREKSTRKITVLPGECVEVFLDFTLYEADALDALNIIRKDDEEYHDKITITEYEKSVTVDREFTINQNDILNQVMKLYVTFSFPILQVSTGTVAFGQVVLHETKKLSFELENKSDTPVEYWLSLRDDSPEFGLVCDRGVLPPCPQPHLYVGAVILVTFTPTEQGSFDNTLVVTTIIPDEKIEVELTGYGSINQVYSLKHY